MSQRRAKGKNRTHSEVPIMGTRQMFTIEIEVRNIFGTEKHEAFAWDTTRWLRCSLCWLNPCNAVAQVGHITACYSRLDDTNMLLTLGRLGPKSDRRENNSHHPQCKAHLHPFCVVSHSCMVAEQVFLELVY